MCEPFCGAATLQMDSKTNDLNNWGHTSLPSSLPPILVPPKASPCSCPSSLNTISETVHHSQCPICLSKFDAELCAPIGLSCSHVICKKCFCQLYPNGWNQLTNKVDLTTGIPNLAMLAYLGYPVEKLMLIPAEGSVSMDSLANKELGKIKVLQLGLHLLSK